MQAGLHVREAVVSPPVDSLEETMRNVGDRLAIREHATVIVMAGGQSTRMGQDKSLLLVNGKPMIEHVCDQVRDSFDEILISANDPQKYAFLKAKVVQDKATGQGPLMGIESALSASANELNFVIACDMPEIELSLVRRMLKEAAGYDAVVLRAGGQIEPLFAVYRKNLAATAASLLESGERRLRALLDHCRTKYVDIDDADRMRNLNRMEEYKDYIARTDLEPKGHANERGETTRSTKHTKGRRNAP